MDRRIRLLGAPVDLLDRQRLLQRIERALANGERLRVEGLNVAKLVDARRDATLLRALEDAEVVHVDGAGISLALRCLRQPRLTRIAGIDLMQALCAEAARSGRPIYLLGARAHVLDATVARLQASYPGLRVAGSRDGYFGERELPEVVAQIRASGAELLFIGISSPKKERFLHDHWHELGVTVGMGVGGSFDVLAGHLRRAPRLMQRCGMEWLFRLLQEPRRLFGRYLRTNLVFLGLLGVACLRGGVRREAGR